MENVRFKHHFLNLVQDFKEWKILEELFPDSRILLCHFHVLKWMKKIISSAPVVMNLRVQIYESFRKLLYSFDATDFEVKLKEWNKLIEGVFVKTSTAKSSEYVSLRSYFDDNWVHSCLNMWVMYERKSLPIATEHTTNRVERSFGVIKYILSMNNRKNISMESAIMQIVEWAEGKIVSGNVNSMRKEMSIFDADPEIREVYRSAAGVLNKSGCLALKKTIELFRKYEGKMSVCDSGIRESSSISGSAGELGRNYQTSETRCDCTYWRKNQHVCRHILFLRSNQNLPLLAPECFADYYLKVVDSGPVKLPEDQCKDGPKQPNLADSSPEMSDEENHDFLAFNHNEKFRISQDSLHELTELLPRFGTKEFSRYMWEIEILKNRIRKGEQIFTVKEEKPDVEYSVNPHKINTGDRDNKAHNSFIQLNDEVNWLKFEKNLKKRGRPKKKKGRVIFNRSKVDCKVTPAVTTMELPIQAVKPSSIFLSPQEELVPPKEDQVQKKSNFRRFDHICSQTPANDQIGGNTITFHDYASLVEGKYVTDTIVNWSLRQLSMEHPSSRVTVLSTEFYQRLEIFGTSVTDERLYMWANGIEKFDADPQLVVLPVCWQSHFYILIAMLDTTSPTIYILESLGGSRYGQIPPFTNRFCSLLTSVLGAKGVSIGDFALVLLDVPRQPFSSNNCGIFAIHFVELVLRDQANFVTLAATNQLADWFPPNSLNSKRGEIAAKIAQEAESQRAPGENMCGKPIDLPLQSPDFVSRQVFSIN